MTEDTRACSTCVHGSNTPDQAPCSICIKYTEPWKPKWEPAIRPELGAEFAKTAQSALNVQVGGGHYKGLKIQPVEYIHANNLPFIEGSIIKYATRWRDKGGIKDLEKIKHFVDLLIELEGKE